MSQRIAVTGPAARLRIPAREANRFTIRLDEWGVPHIFGRTDASAVFGAGFAQAEDNWPQGEDNFVRAIGRPWRECRTGA